MTETMTETDELWNYELNIPKPDFTNVDTSRHFDKVCPGAPKLHKKRASISNKRIDFE